MRVITIQHKNVYDMIQNKGAYRAKEDRVSEILVKPYQFMQQQFGWKSTPIFMSPVGYYVEMGGAKFNSESVAIELEIPDSLVKIQRYYDWSDFIYFTEQPWEFKDACNVDKFENVNDWGKTILNIKVTSDCKDPIQCSVEELRKDWIVDITDRLNKLEDMHNDTGGKNKLKNLSFYK